MRNRKTIVAGATALLALAPALAACGGASDEDGAKGAAQDSLHALGEYDGEKFCTLRLDKDNAKPLKDDAAAFEKCVATVASFKGLDGKGDLAKLKDAKVTKAEVSGDSATVKLSDIEGLDQTALSALSSGASPETEGIKLKKLGGKWYLENQDEKAATGAPTTVGATPTAPATSATPATGAASAPTTAAPSAS